MIGYPLDDLHAPLAKYDGTEDSARAQIYHEMYIPTVQSLRLFTNISEAALWWGVESINEHLGRCEAL